MQATPRAESTAGLVYDAGAASLALEDAAVTRITGAKIVGTALVGVGAGALGMALTSRRRKRTILRDALIGAVAGVAAGFVMNQTHTIWGAVEMRIRGPRTEPVERTRPTDKPATAKAAEAIAGPLGEQEEEAASSLAHYAMSAVTGALYGALSDAWPVATIGRGVPFGAAVWLAADETAVPALGLSRPPWEYPPNVHARGMVAHIAYGAVLDGVMRIARRVLS